MTEAAARRVGRNGVELTRFDHMGEGFRSYEVHQRERVGQSTEKINGMDLASAAYVRDPAPLLETLRENYPCYLDWANNCYWITRYDDVTSIFRDDANFETRSKLWAYGLEGFGRDLRDEPVVRSAWAQALVTGIGPVAERIVARLDPERSDLATEWAAALPVEWLVAALDVPEDDADVFALRYRQAQRGVGWDGTARDRGERALHELVAYFEPILKERSKSDAPDLVTAVAAAGGDARDLITTLLESDHETLHGALSNLVALLLSSPNALATVRGDRRRLKIAYLETLRHSPPTITTDRYTRHEVERFGRLIPAGAQLRLSALAANRDPRLFADPDRFVVDRRDICHREARGQYRADGLPAGIAFGLGPPSLHPAVPEDRPPSPYALVRDAAVLATTALLDVAPDLEIRGDAAPEIRCLTIGGTYTCWSLPVRWTQRTSTRESKS